MSVRLDWILPNGRSCRIEATDVPAAPALGKLAELTGMRPGTGPADYRVSLKRFSGELAPGHWHLRGCNLSFLGAELEAGAWETMSPRQRGLHLRQLFFLTLLPALRNREVCVVHGALAQCGAAGIAFCGPSGIGKSTTANRLPPHFEVLADDCFLLGRRGDRLYAQGVPTWSIWIYGKPERRFDCARSVPLTRICLLERGADTLQPLEPASRVIGLSPSFGDMLNWYMAPYPPELKRELQLHAFDAVRETARTVPMYRLRCRLGTDFAGLLRPLEDNRTGSQI